MTGLERTLYDDVTRFVRLHLRSASSKTGITRMALIALQMAMGSSSQAAASTLQNMSQNDRLTTDDQS